MLAPASAARASVPPQATDSSSGCAKTARIVRPARPGVSVSTLVIAPLHEPPIDGDILIDHAPRAEARDRPSADAAAIEIEDARELVRHLLEILEDEAGHSLVHHFADRATVECGDR